MKQFFFFSLIATLLGLVLTTCSNSSNDVNDDETIYHFIQSISIPSNLTPGEQFNVTFYYQNTNSNADIYQPIFGLVSSNLDFYQNLTNIIGSQPFAIGNSTNFLTDSFYVPPDEFGLGSQFASNISINLPSRDYFDIYNETSILGGFPNPWLISTAFIEQIGASGSVNLNVLHALTIIDY